MAIGKNIKKPKGLVIENYLETFFDSDNEMNCRIKSIVQPKKVLSFLSPHYAIYKGKKFAVNENFDEIIGEAMYTTGDGLACTMTNSTSKIRINHYWTKSLEELKIKCKRGYPDGCANPKYDEIIKRLSYPMIQDDILVKYAELIKSK